MSRTAGRRAEPIAMKLPKVWLKFQCGEPGMEQVDLGTITVVLRSDLVPKSAENFRGLCEGDYGDREDEHQKKYAGSRIHRIVPTLGFWAGDFERGDGLGGSSILESEGIEDGKLVEEGMAMRHLGRGTVSMWPSTGTDSSASCFFVALARGPLPLLDGRAVVIGYVAAGSETLEAIEAVGASTGYPRQEVTLAACGQLPDDGSAQPGHLKAARTRRASLVTMESKREPMVQEGARIADSTAPLLARTQRVQAGQRHAAGASPAGTVAVGGLKSAVTESRRMPEASIPVPTLRQARPDVFRGPLAQAVRVGQPGVGVVGGAAEGLGEPAMPPDKDPWHGLAGSRGAELPAGAGTTFTGMAVAMARDAGQRKREEALAGTVAGGGVDIVNPEPRDPKATDPSSSLAARGTRLGGPTVGQVLEARQDARARAMLQGGARYGGAAALQQATGGVWQEYNHATEGGKGRQPKGLFAAARGGSSAGSGYAGTSERRR